MSVSVDVETQTLQNPEGRDTGGGRLGGHSAYVAWENKGRCLR